MITQLCLEANGAQQYSYGIYFLTRIVLSAIGAILFHFKVGGGVSTRLDSSAL